MRAVGFLPALAVILAGAASADEIQPPQVSFAAADWTAAAAALPATEGWRPPSPRRGRSLRSIRTANPGLAALNDMMAQRFTGLGMSPAPVLLPFDIEAFLRDQASATGAAGNERYMSGFQAVQFLEAGPSGYDATFTVRAGDVPELSEVKFARPIEVQISASLLLYDLEAPMIPENWPDPGLQAEFPGLRRMILERQLRYTFVRFGVPYLVSITCFDGATSRYKMPSCKSADVVGQRFLHALRFVGGMPRRLPLVAAPPIERPDGVSPWFAYHGPGRLLPGTSVRDLGGRIDRTAYAQIRFPLANVPSTAGSELFRRRRDLMPAGDATARPIAPWRDNFCERRGFPVAQCPGGIGHQGQDLRPVLCTLDPGMQRCEHHGAVVAVRDGVIMRAPGQEAAYLMVNTGTEHIRFRYLHMSPRQMDASGLLSGRRVYEGEVIGEVSNFSMKEAGTSYHAHFDMQVPTRYGWVFVNPYMTLVAAYERLIGARGTELVDPAPVTSADASGGGAVASATHIEPDRPRRVHNRHARARIRAHRRQHVARR